MRISLMLFLAIAGAAQPAPPPTFRTATRLVEVEVAAKRRGVPAAGLTRGDFTLSDNGKPQKISFFSVRSARPSEAGSARPSEAASAPLPPGAVSNRLERAGDGIVHATVLLIDQRNTSRQNQAFAIQRIAKFVARRRLRDRIGIYTFLRDGSLQAVQDLTDDSDLLLRAAAQLKAIDPTYRSPDTTGMAQHAAEDHVMMELTSRVMDTKHVMKAIARHLANVPGRKNLIWITTSFALMWPLPPYQIKDFNPDMEDAARALNDADVAVYAVDARGLIGALSGATPIANAEAGGAPPPRQAVIQMSRGGGDPPGLDTMSKLSGLTGGRLFYQTNGLEDSIQQAVEDSDLTYTLGFYPLEEDQDGAWHKLRVEARPRGVSLRYREKYFAGRAPAGSDERPSLDDLLKDSLDATQLEVTAAAAPDPARPGFYKVRVNFDLRGVELKQENARHRGAVVVSFLAGGRLRTRTLDIDIPDDRFAAFLAKGIDTFESIDAPGKPPYVRVVVQDRATGAAGSVRVPVERR